MRETYEAVAKQLAEEQELSYERVLEQGVALYQLQTHRAREGYRMVFVSNSDGMIHPHDLPQRG